MQRELRRIVEEERRKGKKAWVGYGKVEIEGQWWKWDEERAMLSRDGGTGGGGKSRGGEGGKIRGKARGEQGGKRGRRNRGGGRRGAGAGWMENMLLERGGTRKKDRGVLESVREWDVVVMMETWIDEKRWDRMRAQATRRVQVGGANGK